MDELHWIRHLLYQVLIHQEKTMATIAEVQASVAELKTKFEAYVTTQQGSATASELDTIKTAIDAITAEVPA